MNIGAIIAEYQKPQLIWSPKIQAVMGCSRMAAGRATRASTDQARVESLRVVTRDQRFAMYGVDVLSA